MVGLISRPDPSCGRDSSSASMPGARLLRGQPDRRRSPAAPRAGATRPRNPGQPPQRLAGPRWLVEVSEDVERERSAGECVGKPPAALPRRTRRAHRPQGAGRASGFRSCRVSAWASIASPRAKAGRPAAGSRSPGQRIECPSARSRSSSESPRLWRWASRSRAVTSSGCRSTNAASVGDGVQLSFERRQVTRRCAGEQGDIECRGAIIGNACTPSRSRS